MAKIGEWEGWAGERFEIGQSRASKALRLDDL